jgi:hypothetical protein
MREGDNGEPHHPCVTMGPMDKLVILIFTATTVASFSYVETPSFLQKRTNFRSRALSDAIDFSFSQTDNKPELWLDLRGTALYPKAAVSYLLKELTDESDPFFLPSEEAQDLPIQKVLVSNDMFQRIVDSPGQYMAYPDMLYSIPGDFNENIVLSRNGQSFPYGTVVTMRSDSALVVDDPMQTMDFISQGNWVVLVDGEDDLDPYYESARGDSIASFLDIVWAASSSGRSTMLFAQLNGDSRGLLLPTTSGTKESDGESKEGGLALSCSTKSMLVQLASNIKSLQAGVKTSTKSGILIQSAASLKPSSFLATALLLPFDLALWKTAMLIYGEQPTEEEDSV